MTFIKKLIPAKTKRFIKSFLKVLTTVKCEDYNRVAVACDLLYCIIRFRVSCDEYLKYRFYELSNRYRKYFVLISHQRHEYFRIITRRFTYSKYEFYNRMPDLYHREIIRLPDCGEERLLEFAKKHKRFVVKPDHGSLGKNIKVFDYTNDKDVIDLYNYSFAGDQLVCEEFIKQHQLLTEFNPASVNTVRVVTLFCDDVVKIISAAIKFGAGDSIVDNMHRGGVGAQIDIDTGIVSTFGFDYKYNKFTHHPVSNKKIIGLEVPHWDMVKERVIEAHKRVPQCSLYGWDVAITQNDVDIVEANNAPGPMLMQTMDRIPKGRELFKAFRKGNPNKIDIKFPKVKKSKK